MYEVLTANTGHVIYRSLLRPTNTNDDNLRASKFAGDPSTHNEVVKSRNSPPHIMDESKPADTVPPSPVLNPEDLIGRSFLQMDKDQGLQLSNYVKIMNLNLKITPPESISSVL
jgi:hypothetical protein